ncbi:LamG domain-containing protein [Paraglaciecola sp. L3A3]|uniref:LamG domain-containing protein n=1 Tax=Paraglaciecola sp. L3A3 TaxID=2686358 RepID=UPI00131DEE98|nr:LamG domain-containing protein [Paraglaciecola sp. L3A3]
MNKFTCSGLLLMGVVTLTSCGGNGVAEVVETPLPPTDQQPVENYAGPAPSTDDIQNFKLALWDNIATEDRCGACHVQGEQSPSFARNDDINLAYTDTNPLITLDSPKDSLLVTKVAGGHNCWLSSAQACADILTTWIANWRGDEAVATEIVLEAPMEKTPGENKNFPADSHLFSTTVYPLLTANCASCHTNSAAIPISPYFAAADINEAYEAAIPRLNLDSPMDSRVVGRVRDEFHNCWTDCASDAQSLVAAIQDMADQIDTTALDPSLVYSKALTLFDGTLATGGGRFESNLIAKWEFKTGSGNTAFDTSGVEPALNLTLSGEYDWVGGYGIQLADGKAQGSTTNSKKIHDLLTSTGELSIEAWIAPANVTQEGPARIVSYSGGKDRRNFTLGQTLYNYDVLLRSDQGDVNGIPMLSTADGDEDLQAALQHVVVNFSPITGRQIYVNGVFTDDLDEQTGAILNEWDDSFAFVLGNEVSGDMPWAGTIRMVAMHNRVLEPGQIIKNFDAGIGQKYFLLFNLSEWLATEQSYIVFKVSQFDNYSYLFSEPYFYNLNSEAIIPDVSLQGLTLGLNGRELTFGQAYANLDTQISPQTYIPGEGQPLSRLGTLVQLEKGPAADEFFLLFDQIGEFEHVRVEAAPPATAIAADTLPQPDIGVKNFAEINASMSVMTGVPLSNAGTKQTFDTLSQQLPSVTNIDSFLASNQMAVTQLAIKYCDALVSSTSLRSAYFSGFDFSQPASTAFTTEVRQQLTTSLLDNMLGSDIESQPSRLDVENELNQLISQLSDCSGDKVCDAQYTQTIVKASCAAVLGSAAMLIQ